MKFGRVLLVLVALQVISLALVGGDNAGAVSSKHHPPKKPKKIAAPHVTPARDGMIVFVSDRDGSNAIWGIAPGGTQASVRELTHPNADNGESDSDPSFSPNGKQLVFIRQNSDGGTDLWIAGADGSGSRQLVADVEAAAFAPDGKQLAVIVPSENSENALALVSSSGGAPKIICDENYGVLGSPAFSPDGKQLAYSDGGRGIVVATLGSPLKCSAELLGTIGADGPTYAPDGTIAWDEPAADIGATDIWIKHPGKATQRIIANGSNNITPVIAPAGDRIAFSNDAGGEGTQVFTAKLDGSGVTSIGDPQTVCTAGYCVGDSNPGWQPLR